MISRLTMIFLVVLAVPIAIQIDRGVNNTTIAYPILSLKNKNEIKGRFFLACGGIGTKEYYIVMFRNGQDIHRFRIPIEYATLIESPSPRIQFTAPRRFFADIKYLKGYLSMANIRIFIPPDSIIRKMKID